MPFQSALNFLKKDNIDVAPQHEAQHEAKTTPTKTAGVEIGPAPQQDVDEPPEKYVPDAEAQNGVKKVEAITLSWTRSELIVAYISFFLLYFVNAFQSSITSNLTPFVLSGFESHSLIPVIYIVSNVMSAATYFPQAKILDLWGRPQGFFIMASLATLGLILMATTKTVQTFAAAQVFYSVGFSGMIFTIDVMTADSSKLRHRGLAFAFTSSPFIITALAGPKAAEGFYENISWRWAFGVFTIILPVVATPLFLLLLKNERKARKNGLLVREASGRTLTQSIWHYFIEFDGLGVFLLAAGLVIFLLPFSLADSTPESWRRASTVSMLVIGFLTLVAFICYERFGAPKPFIPYHLLISRTILGACILDATYMVAYYCWGSYFSSYLQVVNNLTITQAGWVTGIFDMIAGLWLIFVGFLMMKTGRFKWLLLSAVPVYTLGVGLLIYFRRPHTNIGYIIMCQIFLAFSGSTMILGMQVAVMSVAEHGDIAAVLAILGLFGYVGGAIGNSISGAIWTNTLPVQLQKFLPESCAADWETIYNDLTVQLSYPMDDPCREAIIQSYGVAQKRMLIAGTAIMAIAVVCVFLIKNVKINRPQMKGVLF